MHDGRVVDLVAGEDDARVNGPQRDRAVAVAEGEAVDVDPRETGDFDASFVVDPQSRQGRCAVS